MRFGRCRKRLRYASGSGVGSKTNFSVWDGRFSGALLGLPRSRDELTMNMHLVAARLEPDAPLVLFGRKDAGIAAAQRAAAAVFAQVTLAQTKFHGRILLATGPHHENLVDQMDDWRRAHTVNVLGKEISLVSYPGLFAGGALDAGTALLLRMLPQWTKPPKMMSLCLWHRCDRCGRAAAMAGGERPCARP